MTGGILGEAGSDGVSDGDSDSMDAPLANGETGPEESVPLVHNRARFRQPSLTQRCEVDSVAIQLRCNQGSTSLGAC